MGDNVIGKVNCGNWVYPSKDSFSSVQYPIEVPLVLELFQQLDDKSKTTVKKGGICHHLHGPRYLEVEITPEKLKILTLKNKQESAFELKVGFECNYAVNDLARKDDFRCYGDCQFTSLASTLKSSSDNLSIFTASVLLQEYLRNGNNNFPKEIVFREATIPEIESIGAW